MVQHVKIINLYTSTPKTKVRLVGRSNCGGTDINSTYRQCLVSTRPSTTFFTALILFDTGAFTSFFNREVAKWLEQRQREGTSETVFSTHSSKFDIPTASVGLAGTQLSSSIYGTVVADLTLFNEVMQSDDILTNIRACVIDSCIELSSDYPMYECIGSYIAYPPTSTLLTQPTSSSMRRWTTRRPQ